jgi:DNA-binding CsgD family transcriptional regulator
MVTPNFTNHLSTDQVDPAQVVALVQTRLVRLESLTRRQRDVLQLLSVGATNTQISNRLDIARPTVETHVKDLKHKLGVSSRSLLAVIGYLDIVSATLEDLALDLPADGPREFATPRSSPRHMPRADGHHQTWKRAMSNPSPDLGLESFHG